MYRISVQVSTMVRYNRGKAFAKMYPVLCENGKVCKEYAKTAGVRDGKRGGGFAARIVGGGVPDAPHWGQDFPLRTDFK